MIMAYGRELKIYDTENRLQGVVQPDGTLYDASGDYRGEIADADQQGCMSKITSGQLWSLSNPMVAFQVGTAL
jgi:YD repeat-containing protein